jgi:hypothetical protein
MSIVFHYTCPNCGNPTDLSLNLTCAHVSSKGKKVCGYRLPQTLAAFNSMMCGKVEKHTQEPPGTFNGLISFNPSTGFYLQNREQAMTSGNVYLDRREGFFCTYITPSGDNAIATVCSGNNANRFQVSGYKLPLNSRVHELHGRYADMDSNMLFVATPEGTVIEAPNPGHPDEYHVLQSGNLVAGWNIVAQSGFCGGHVVIR